MLQQINPQFSTSEKVQFLSRARSYPQETAASDMRVEVIETHMSRVFLTKQYAYKLKKPVCHRFVNFSPLTIRHQNCQTELQLNRRLAPHVYLEVVPIVVTSQGNLQLGGDGSVVDWLVKMRRLPAEDMLDIAIQQGIVEEKDITQVTRHLVDFYRKLSPVSLSTTDYLDRLRSDL